MMQQLLITGIGGQGVLFLTRVLSAIAIADGAPVMTSENHGMAQRGGTVDSHVKIGEFTSPLIRSGHADGILVLHGEDFALFDAMRSATGWAVVNSSVKINSPRVVCVDATEIATREGHPQSINMALLGVAVGALKDQFFATEKQIELALHHIFHAKPVDLQNGLRIFSAGLSAGQALAI